MTAKPAPSPATPLLACSEDVVVYSLTAAACVFIYGIMGLVVASLYFTLGAR